MFGPVVWIAFWPRGTTPGRPPGPIPIRLTAEFVIGVDVAGPVMGLCSCNPICKYTCQTIYFVFVHDPHY